MVIMLFVNRGVAWMGHSQAEKAENRERILAEASRQVRRDGLESVGVGTLMKSVGLTHGGFYGHFESRSALLAEALERALLEGEANAKAQGSDRPQSFAHIVRSYLSRAHRDARESGCAIAALVSDVARADTSSREVMTDHIESLHRIGDRGARRGRGGRHRRCQRHGRRARALQGGHGSRTIRRVSEVRSRSS